MQSNTHVGSIYAKDNSRIHVGNVVQIHQTEDRCLSDLRNTDPRHDKARIEDTKGGLFEDSYRWILEHSDFRQWRDDKRSQLLWIKGDPGKGKTMLLCGIVNELTPQTKLKDEKANTVLSYFFCQAADERINSATAVLRGLIYLIVEQQPTLVSHIQKQYKNGGEAIFKDVNAWSLLSEIFLNILKDSSLGRTYVIIDALDECVTDLPKLLDFINTKSALFPRIKWIVSSRNWPNIEERLDSATKQMRLCLELNEKSVSAAVNAYIEHQVNQLAQKKKYNAQTKAAVQHHLSSNSNDTFLWVALVCQNLENISLKNILLKLNEFPPGLNALYKRMVKQISRLGDISDTKLCYRILGIVLLVYRPLTLTELGSLIKSPDDDLTDAESIHKAVELCGSLLTVKDSRVYVIHQSAKDYLSDKALSTPLLPSPADIHGVLFSRSIQAMSATLRRNIYKLDSHGLPRNAIKTPDPDPLSAIRYSCVYWIDHFCDMHSGNNQSQKQVDNEKFQTVFLFLRKHFLYWLEALGLMGHVEDGVLSLARIEDLLRGDTLDGEIRGPTRDSGRFYPFRLILKNLLRRISPDDQSLYCQVLELVQDTRRFIQQNISLIADIPLQAYTSALIFSPLNSLTRNIFKEEEPPWLKVKPSVEYNWGPYLQTIKGHIGIVQSVTFSPDGRYLASGSDDTTIKIWNVITGKEQKTFKGHAGSIWSISFSPDGRCLASGSGDRTVKIWDIKTGKEQQTFSHSDCVWSVAFSSDGRYLISGSDDKTIKIWDMTGKVQQTLNGHTASVRSVVFSPDGRHLASGSGDMTIKIWNVEGKEKKTLSGHLGRVQSVAFSSNGRYLASGSDDTTIKIWSTITGKVQQTLNSHNGSVRSVIFSSDGRYLASGSFDETIEIWDIKTSTMQQTLKGHSGVVWSIAFSPDARYLASASSDETIKIWDTTGKEQHTLKGHGSTVKSVAVSADGRYLASGSYDNTIKVWDTTTGKELQTFKGHSGFRLTAVSADNHYFALESYGTISIWDITTGEELQKFEINFTIHTISFDDTASYLHTDVGRIKLDLIHRPEAQSTVRVQDLSLTLDPAQDQNQAQRIADNTRETNHLGYGLSTDKCWITWHEHNILWLPPEYQPSVEAVWPSASCSMSLQESSTDVVMALGSESGRVVVIRLPVSGPYPLEEFKA